MRNIQTVTKSILESIDVKKNIASNHDMQNTLMSIADVIVEAFQNNGTVLFCGNGGSAADAQHLSAELSGRFKFDRDPLNSDALHCNTSYVTAVANDYSYDQIYARLVKAKMHKDDVLIGLSTSGNSKNILEAFLEAKKRNVVTVLFTGEKLGKIESECNPDYVIRVPSCDTARIQESHIMLGHIVCELVENKLFGEK